MTLILHVLVIILPPSLYPLSPSFFSPLTLSLGPLNSFILVADVEALKKTSSGATTMATVTTTETAPSLNTSITPSRPRQGHIPASTMSETSTETGSTEIAQNTQNVRSILLNILIIRIHRLLIQK